MSDFLSRLVDRTLGQASVTQPLIAPFFAQGAEIFAPDAVSTPLDVTETESYRYGEEQAFNAVSQDAIRETAPRFDEETRLPSLMREESESQQEPPREQHSLHKQRRSREQQSPHEQRSEISEVMDVVQPSSLPERSASNPPSPMIEQREEARSEAPQPGNEAPHEIQPEAAQIIKRPAEISPADEVRKDMQSPESEQPPAATNTEDSTSPASRSIERRRQKSATSRADAYSDGEESLTPTPPLRRAAENQSASTTEPEEKAPASTKTSSATVVSPPAEQKPQQSSRKEARGLSRRGQPTVTGNEDSAIPESHSIEHHKSVTPQSVAPRDVGAHRQIERPTAERPSPVIPHDVRNDNDNNNEERAKSAGSHELLVRQAAVQSEESVIPALAAPLRDESNAARIIARPEKVTARSRSDLRARATTTDAQQNTQQSTKQSPAAAPTIKVTIGRIEVRAISPPAPPVQETALPAPRMSLDDYLKSVSGERR